MKRSELPDVLQDQFQTWLHDPITLHLFRDLENAYLDCMLDPLPARDLDTLTIEAIKREGRREFAELLEEWAPRGCIKKAEDD